MTMFDEVIKFITSNIQEFSVKSFLKLFSFSLIIVIILLGAFPFIENNYIKYSNLKSQSQIIKDLGAIPYDRLSADSQLQYSYNQILMDLEELRNDNNTNYKQEFISTDNHGVWWKKVISGSVLSFFMLIIMLFDKKSEKSQKNKNLLVMFLIALASGALSILVPVFVNKPILTYIGIPIFQIAGIVLIVVLTKKNNGKK